MSETDDLRAFPITISGDHAMPIGRMHLTVDAIDAIETAWRHRVLVLSPVVRIGQDPDAPSRLVHFNLIEVPPHREPDDRDQWRIRLVCARDVVVGDMVRATNGTRGAFGFASFRPVISIRPGEDDPTQVWIEQPDAPVWRFDGGELVEIAMPA